MKKRKLVAGIALVGLSSPSSGQEVIRSYLDHWSDFTAFVPGAFLDDLDGDGIQDLAIGDPFYRTTTGHRSGRVLLVSGASEEVFAEFVGMNPMELGLGGAVTPFGDVTGDDVSDLFVTGTRSFRVVDGASRTEVFQQEEGRGYAAANLGDVNGDGINDFVVGFPGLIGVTRVYHGGTFTFTQEKRGLLGGILGYRAVSLGDVSMDGISDYAVSAPGAIFGGYVGRVDVFSGSDGALLYSIPGIEENDQFGQELAAPGDLNGDGITDLVIGSPGLGPTATERGGVFFHDGATGARIAEFLHRENDHRVGQGLATVGDVNGNGVNDILFRRQQGFDQQVLVMDGATRLVLYLFEDPFDTPATHLFGIKSHGVDDWNGDDFPDMAIGTSLPFPEQQGYYIYSGAPPGVRTFGTGCPAAPPAPRPKNPSRARPAPGFVGPTTERDDGVPRIGFEGSRRTGRTFQIHLSEVAPGVSAQLFLGMSRTEWKGRSLPLDLGFLGLPGCELLVAPETILKTKTISVGPNRGAATLTFPFPTDPSLLGSGLYAQWMVEDLSRGRGWALTRALEIHLPGGLVAAFD